VLVKISSWLVFFLVVWSDDGDGDGDGDGDDDSDGDRDGNNDDDNNLLDDKSS